VQYRIDLAEVAAGKTRVELALVEVVTELARRAGCGTWGRRSGRRTAITSSMPIAFRPRTRLLPMKAGRAR